MTMPKYSPNALREVLHRHGLSGSQAGRLLRVDGRTIRKWTAAAEVATHREMPESTWLLLLILTGEVTVAEALEDS